jgi:hypothetical protein
LEVYVLSQKSPYLLPTRLADVIAAIQVMGTYKFYKLPFDKWADRISGDEEKGEYWRGVFVEHPEFFRLDSAREKASLVWRRQYPKRYDVDSGRLLSKDEYYQLNDERRDRVSRNPLTPDDIKALIETAIDLHSRVLEQHKESRWWVNTLTGAVGGLVVAIISTLLGWWLK